MGYCIFIVLQQDKTNLYHCIYGTINGTLREGVKWNIRVSRTKLEFYKTVVVHYLCREVPISVRRIIILVQFMQKVRNIKHCQGIKQLGNVHGEDAQK